MTQHALLSASGSVQWYPCPGSLAAQKDEEDKSSIYAEEGTAMHAFGSAALEEGRPAAGYVGRIFKSEEGTEFAVSEEDADYMQRYLDQVSYYRNNPKGDPHFLMIEQRVLYGKEIGVSDDLAFGTSDAIVCDEELSELIVIDLKWGMGVRVDAKDNTQLMLYALGALRLVSPFFTPKSVRMAIVQPRLNHVSEEAMEVADLLKWAWMICRFRATKALAMYRGEMKPELNAGDKQCKFCTAFATCDEARERAYRAGIEGLDEEPMDAHNVKARDVSAMDLEELARSARLVPFLEDFCRAVTGRVDIEVLKHGKKVPGFKAVAGKAPARTWKDEESVVTVLSDAKIDQAITHEPPKPAALKTPTQMEKTAKSKLPEGVWENIALQIFKGKGKATVVPESDPRPAIVVDPTSGLTEESDGSDLA